VTGGLAFLFIAVVVAGIGSLVLWMRNRGSTSVDSGVEEFQREMRALSPDKRDEDRRRRSG
jgi:hypothetical protein